MELADVCCLLRSNLTDVESEWAFRVTKSGDIVLLVRSTDGAENTTRLRHFTEPDLRKPSCYTTLPRRLRRLRCLDTPTTPRESNPNVVKINPENRTQVLIRSQWQRHLG